MITLPSVCDLEGDLSETCVYESLPKRQPEKMQTCQQHSTGKASTYGIATKLQSPPQNYGSPKYRKLPFRV